MAPKLLCAPDTSPPAPEPGPLSYGILRSSALSGPQNVVKCCTRRVSQRRTTAISRLSQASARGRAYNIVRNSTLNLASLPIPCSLARGIVLAPEMLTNVSNGPKKAPDLLEKHETRRGRTALRSTQNLTRSQRCRAISRAWTAGGGGVHARKTARDPSFLRMTEVASSYLRGPKNRLSPTHQQPL